MGSAAGQPGVGIRRRASPVILLLADHAFARPTIIPPRRTFLRFVCAPGDRYIDAFIELT